MRMTLILALATVLMISCVGPLAKKHECGPECNMHKPEKMGQHHQPPMEGESKMGDEGMMPMKTGTITGSAQQGEFVSCPVSGEMVEVGAKAATYEFEGKTYYFCCENCLAKFKADPGAYTD